LARAMIFLTAEVMAYGFFVCQYAVDGTGIL
jgi:hypothetical protein